MTGDAVHQEPREGPGDRAAWRRNPAVHSTRFSQPSPTLFLEKNSPVRSGSQFCCELRDVLKWD